jgi:antitoxin CptB
VATESTSETAAVSDASRQASDTELEIRRLRWQCRRGMLELDHLLDRFLDLGYRDLRPAQRLDFVRLLAEQDQRLSDWFMSRAEPPDAALRDLVRHIVEAVRERRLDAGD